MTQLEPSKRVSPPDRLISQLDGVYFKLGEAAQLVNRSPITLRRLIRKNLLKAPSYQVRQGANFYYLYTPDDIEELKRYYRSMPVEPRVREQDE